MYYMEIHMIYQSIGLEEVTSPSDLVLPLFSYVKFALPIDRVTMRIKEISKNVQELSKLNKALYKCGV